MKRRNAILMSTVSLLFAVSVQAQEAGQQAPDSANETPGNEIVVTGIRASLSRAADIKRDAPQVVESIVAQDIGKFPDPTTAAALQRVPGVQVTVGGNNEIVNPLIRGLGDIMTTLDGREIFTAEGRGFAFQDLPAEALAQVDVYKSNTANLIEGGVAGTIDLKLNKAFNYKEPTIAISGKLNYASNAEKLGPQVSALWTDRWDTGIGEIGLLVNASWYNIKFNRPSNYVAERRAGNVLGGEGNGVAIPISTGGLNEYGSYSRPQLNASLQWQAAPNLEVYVDGLYSAYRGKVATAFYEYQLFNSDSVNNVTTDGNCFNANLGNDGFNGTANPNQQLCNLTGGTFNNVSSFTSMQAKNQKTDSIVLAGGTKYTGDRLKLALDVSYQKSLVRNETFIIDTGKKVGQVNVDFDNPDNTAAITVPGNPMAYADGFTFVNGLYQEYTRSKGELFATKFDDS